MPLHEKIAQYQHWEENLRTNKKGWYGVLWVIKKTLTLIFVTIAGIFITGTWEKMQWGWVVVTVQWIIGLGILGGFFLWDIQLGKLKGYQLFR
jgi:hypothetical protein